MRLALAPALAAVAATAAASADIVTVTIDGTVFQNQITAPPLGQFQPGQAATISFLLDSNAFVDSAMFPTRGYVIDQSSFVLSTPTASVGLASPFPAGATPYFVLRNNDPAVDGFFLSTDVAGPTGLPLSQQGIFGPFVSSFSVTYSGDTLPSLNILDALGTYDFTGLTAFNFTVDDASFSPIIIDFNSMTIVPAPGALAALALVPMLGRRRRR